MFGNGRHPEKAGVFLLGDRALLFGVDKAFLFQNECFVLFENGQVHKGRFPDIDGLARADIIDFRVGDVFVWVFIFFLGFQGEDFKGNDPVALFLNFDSLIAVNAPVTRRRSEKSAGLIKFLNRQLAIIDCC